MSEVLKSWLEVGDEFGQYAIRYVTAEKIVVSERCHLVPNIKGDRYKLIIEFEIFYTGDDEKLYITKFSVGLDGTMFKGNHLLVAPKPILPKVVAVPEDRSQIPSLKLSQ